MMIRICTIITCILLFTACTEQSRKEEKIEKEDLKAKELLQGTWIDDMTETPLLQFKGDTLYYMDESVSPVAFKVIKDSLKTYGQQTSSYHIEKQGEYIFWIQSTMGEILQLSKAESSIDTLFSVQEAQTNEHNQEVMVKDHIVHFNNTRCPSGNYRRRLGGG